MDLDPKDLDDRRSDSMVDEGGPSRPRSPRQKEARMRASYGSPELILFAAIVTLLFAASWIPQLRRPAGARTSGA
jgi:hypothetical protein